MLRLQYADIDSKEVTLVDQAKDWEFTDFNWSPDSKWIAYARPERQAATKLYLYELASKNKNAVTDNAPEDSSSMAAIL